MRRRIARESRVWVAQALKLQTILLAKREGVRYERTNNDSQNAPMLAVNRKLGYKPEPGIYHLLRTLYMRSPGKPSFLLRIYRLQQGDPSILWQGDGSRRKIALTFDDGPHSTDTPRVLEALARYEVRATFFLVGRYVERHPDIVRQIHQNGHLLGIHCYRHVPFPLEHSTNLRAQLERTRNAIAGICGISPETIRHIRPPYGIFTRRTLSLLEGMGFQLVLWDNMPLHFIQPLHWTVTQLVKRVSPGSVIVLHDGHGHGTRAAEIVESVVPQIQAVGIEFVTVDEMQNSENRLG